MKTWEYDVLYLRTGGPTEILEMLNERGSQGWELCYIIEEAARELCIFKRERIDAALMEAK